MSKADGSPDEKDWYDAGMQVVVQQIDAIIYDSMTSNEAVRRIMCWIEDFWRERES